jgi:cell shape-determining protein MreC
MQKKFIISYLCIFFTILGLMSLSRPVSEKLRGTTIALFAPLWESLLNLKRSFAHPLQPDPSFTHASGILLSSEEEINRLELENQLLINQLASFKELLGEKQDIDRKRELETFQNDESYKKYVQRLSQTLQFKLQALPARVIFRSLDTWNNMLWINVGEEDNQKAHTVIVAKHSPILAGQSIVGVIDYVGKKQSRVRLITDPALTPAVRAVRGGEQDDLMLDYVNFLIQLLEQKKTLSLSPNDQEKLVYILKTLKNHLQTFKK